MRTGASRSRSRRLTRVLPHYVPVQAPISAELAASRGRRAGLPAAQAGRRPRAADQGGSMPEPSAAPDLDAVAGRVMAELLDRSHLMRPVDVAGALAQAARPLGVSAVQVYVADLQQRRLAPLAAAGGRAPDVLPIDSTLAGRAYQTITVQSGRAGQAHQLWIPLVDGTERLGVLGLVVTDLSEAMLARYRTLASLAGMLIAGKSSHTDIYAQAQRSTEM